MKVDCDDFVIIIPASPFRSDFGKAFWVSFIRDL
jgi:hypothetical protein